MPNVKHININSTQYDIAIDAMTGASSSASGTSGAVPAPASGDQGKFLKGDGTWGDASSKAIKASYEETTALYDHAVDDIIYVNEYLRKVTVAITAGDTISDGVNVTATTGIEADTQVYVENVSGEYNGVYLANSDGSADEYGNTNSSGGGGTTIVQKPTVEVGTYTYDGTAQGPTITNLDSTNTTVTNATKTNAGEYTLTIALKNASNMVWNDFTNSPITYTYTIDKATLTVPTVSGSFTYDGTAKSATITGYDSDTMTKSGDSATDAGDYTVTFGLVDSTNYEWATTPATGSWSIAKAEQTVTLSANTVELDASTMYSTVTVTHSVGNGTLSVASSSDSIATASLSGTTITINAIASGSATITVTASGTSNYTEKQVTIAVTVSLVDAVLDNNSWSAISSASLSGSASSYWDVGDCKGISLSGTVGTLSLSTTLYVFILGFDHNSSVEGTGIQFGCFKTAKSSGTDVALCDSSYGSNKSDGTKAFNMNHWGGSSSPYNTNYGGWKGCDARYDILGSTNVAPSGYGSTPTTSRVGYDPSSYDIVNSPKSGTLLAAFPSDLRAVMRTITKYTDNTGNSSNVSGNVTTSVDYLPLLSEFEVQGARTYANEYEKNYQAQYDYYKNGNAKIKYNHSSTATAVIWWCRSAYYSYANGFCPVYTDGSATHGYSRNGFGLSPAFRV